MTARGKTILWTGGDAAAATGGNCEATFSATGVAIDSRAVSPGDLFVALEGPNFDGHDFVADALLGGAVAVMVHRPPIGMSGGVPMLMVADTMAALEALGVAARNRSRGRVCAITGSVGKTGVKDALKLVLGGQGPVSASMGSFNNHWGLPLSLARMDPDAAFAIFEIGMNHPGEIAPLSRMARPHVGVITTVEAVHDEFFASVEQIADAKAEVFAGMEPGGVAVLNRDNPHFERLAAAARANGAETVIGFGAHEGAEARLIAAAQDAEGSAVEAEVGGQRLAYRVGIPGGHWVINSLATLAAVAALGGGVAAAAGALSGLCASAGRGRRHRVRLAGGSFLLIDESYNASPVSMAAAIEVLGRARPASGGRRIAVLGDMLELGADSGDRHAALAGPLQAGGVELVFTTGSAMGRLWDALPRDMRGGHAATAELLAPLVTAAARPGDVFAVKGSQASRTGRIVMALLALDRDGEHARQRAVNGE